MKYNGRKYPQWIRTREHSFPNYISVNCSSGDITITLPLIHGKGRTFKIINKSTGKITIIK